MSASGPIQQPFNPQGQQPFNGATHAVAYVQNHVRTRQFHPFTVETMTITDQITESNKKPPFRFFTGACGQK